MSTFVQAAPYFVRFKFINSHMFQSLLGGKHCHESTALVFKHKESDTDLKISDSSRMISQRQRETFTIHFKYAEDVSNFPPN